jgi:hypothetical protein
VRRQKSQKLKGLVSKLKTKSQIIGELNLGGLRIEGFRRKVGRFSFEPLA